MTDKKATILFIDDEPENLSTFQAQFRHHFNIIVADSTKLGLYYLRQTDVTAIVCDHKMPEQTGLDFFSNILDEFPDVARIMLTGYADKELLMKSINIAKIEFFLTKPWNRDELLRTINVSIVASELKRKNQQLIIDLEEKNKELTKANEKINDLKSKLQDENEYLRKEIANEFNASIIGASEAVGLLKDKINRVGPTDSTVLILGETGVGKELVARSIHQISRRSGKAFVKINCAAMQPSLIESELFGYEKGSFTGAQASKLGLFQVANEGTIFLDEIGETPIEFQAKLLRVLQDGEFYRVGGVTPIKVDVRVIAATNRNLEAEVERGKFRRDLFYRLNVFPIVVPPLRDRLSDIPPLVNFFIEKLNKRLGSRVESVNESVFRMLQSHSWPGNVRELEAVIERSIIGSDGEELKLFELIEVGQVPEQEVLKLTLDEMTKRYIISILNEVDWKISGKDSASEILDLHPNTLRSLMQRLGIMFKRGSGI
ncbi:MAG: sigma-54-dependent Fis family transcriptional regulator [Cyclobacteriaceae bacterium]|nr:sigma-54-dependent Fis family transcriptional regulator [Cyclobacteriaceae bacterium]